MRLAAAGAALLVTSSACGARELRLVSPELSGDVELVGALFLDASGAAIASTGLLPRDLMTAAIGEVASDAEDASEVVVVGYGRSDLAPYAPPEAAILAGSRLGLLPAGGAALPPPRWVGRAAVLPGVISVRPSQDTPELTAPWLAACPRPDPAGNGSAVDFSCAAALCVPTIDFSGCRFHIDGRPCALGVVEGTINGDGSIALTEVGSLGSCAAVSAPDPERMRLECSEGTSSCRVAVFPRGRELGLEVAAIDLFDVAPSAPPLYLRPPEGYLADLLPVGDRVWVATYDGRFDSTRCTAPEPSRLVAIHRETLVIELERAGPPCLTRLAPDPTGGGFFGVIAGSRTLARFDPDGAVTATAAIDRPSRGLAAVHLESSSDTLAVTLTSTVMPETPGLVIFFDARSLLEVSRSAPLTGNVRSGTFAAGETFVVLDDQFDRALFLRTRDGALENETALRFGATARRRDFNELELHPRSGRIQVTAIGFDAAIFSLQRQLLVGGAKPFERLAEPLTTATAPHDPLLALVSLVSLETPREAVLALYEPLGDRFLPGTAVIGFGPSHRLRTDHRGHAWVALPWQGRVVRVGP